MKPLLPLRTLTAALPCLALLWGCASQPMSPVPLPETAPAATPQAGTAASPVTPPPPPPAGAPEMTEPTASAPAASRMRLDPEQDAERISLWRRIRDGYAIPDVDNDLVRRWEHYYSRQPDYMRRMTERGGRYLFHIVEEIEQRGLPLDLALLPFIESAFNPQAMSRAAASGMWQFMPGTGREFELRQNLFRDDRRDVLASTRAALDYLSRLHQRFGDWHLALAAYNWGQGNVSRALAVNARAGRPGTYEALSMPAETRNYLPKLQAIKNLVLRPQQFGIVLPELHNHPYFISVAIEQDIDVALVAKLADVTLEEFQQLNPQLNKPVILASGTPQVLLPYDNANQFVRALQEHRGPQASWTAWVAPRTLKPGEAARLIGMDEGTLREVNQIPPRMLVRVGSTLLVPRGSRHAQDVPVHVADNAMMALAPEALPPRRQTLRVGAKGETVAALARRVGMRPEALARLNGVSANGRFAPGQQVQVLVPQRTASAPRQRAQQPARARSAARAATRAKATGASSKPQVAARAPQRSAR